MFFMSVCLCDHRAASGVALCVFLTLFFRDKVSHRDLEFANSFKLAGH